MTDKMKNLVVRTISGAVMLAVMPAAMLYSPWSYGALLLVLLVPGMQEFYNLTEQCKAAPQRIIGTAAGVVLFVLNFCAATGLVHLENWLLEGLSMFMLLLFVMFVCELYRPSENPAGNIATTIMGVVYVALPLSLMCYIPVLGDGVWSAWKMLFFVFIIWSNDVFAYLVGMTLGRHRLFERHSPKKSWEGFFGGLAGAVLMGWIASRVMDGSAALWMGLALVAAVTGVLGDLVESMLKRAAGVKDSGNIIPGHGGILDRFDALLLAAPFVVVYMLLLF